jgi:hypothetical protein
MLQSDLVANEPSVNKRWIYVRNGLLVAWNAFVNGESLASMTPTMRVINLDATEYLPQTVSAPAEPGERREQWLFRRRVA